MEKIIFEDSNGRPQMNTPSRGFIMSFLIKKGIVKGESSANVLMIIVSLIFLLGAVYVVYSTFYYQKSSVATIQTSPLQQKTRDYIKQGISPTVAKMKAKEDLSLINPTSPSINDDASIK